MSPLLLIRRRLLRSDKYPLAFSFLKSISTGNFPRNFISVISNPCTFVHTAHNGQVARLKNNGFKKVIRQDVMNFKEYIETKHKSTATASTSGATGNASTPANMNASNAGSKTGTSGMSGSGSSTQKSNVSGMGTQQSGPTQSTGEGQSNQGQS